MLCYLKFYCPPKFSYLPILSISSIHLSIQVHGGRRAIFRHGSELGSRNYQLGPGLEYGAAVNLKNFHGVRHCQLTAGKNLNYLK